MNDQDLPDLLEHYRALGDKVCTAIQKEIDKLGLPPEATVAAPQYAEASFAVVVDPYSGERDLTGHWYDTNRMKIGSLQFHAGGTFFAEYDVVKPHPSKPRWFVEGINVWGTADNIKSEAKLLAAV